MAVHVESGCIVPSIYTYPAQPQPGSTDMKRYWMMCMLVGLFTCS